MWENLNTNLSKYSMQFSDFKHKEEVGLFANKSDISDFLQEYSKKFDLEKYLNLQTNIIKISQKKNLKNGEFSYEILIENVQKEQKLMEFDYVIIASGMSSRGDFSAFEKWRNGQIEILHSSQYKKAEDYINKNVLSIALL